MKEEKMDSNETSVVVLKTIRLNKIVSIGLMVFFTVVAALNFVIFLDSLSPPNWIMLIICGFFCVLFVKNTFGSFRNYQVFSKHYEILKTQGLVALQEYLQKEMGG